MENQKAKMEEIRGKMLQAKTVEELLAIATEAGEPLTTEEATKLLQEIEAEQAMEKRGHASADEDLSDEELAKVVGGKMFILGDDTSTSFRKLTYREGGNVCIYGSSQNRRCEYWKINGCDGVGWGGDRGVFRTAVLMECYRCAYSSSQGALRNRCCTNSNVRAAYGL